MKLNTSLLILTLFLVGCVSTNSVSKNEEDQNDNKKKDENIVCEKVYNTSSRIPKKICTTLADRERIDREEEESKKVLRDAQTRGGIMGEDVPDS